MAYSIPTFLLLSFCAVLLLRPTMPRLSIRKKHMTARDPYVLKRLRIVEKKQTRWELHRQRVEAAVAACGSKITWEAYLRLIAGCAAAGALFGALFNNLLLAVAMAVCFPFLPYQMLRLRGMEHKRYLHMQVEQALGILTNSYMQTGDIRKAVSSSLANQLSPMKEILSDFEMELYVGVNTVTAIRYLREKVDNRHFREWCDRLIQCQSDRTLMVLLPPITEMLADMRQIQTELDTSMLALWREHITIALVVAGSIPCMRLFNAEWYRCLTTTVLGRVVVCLTFVTILISTLYVLHVNRPVSMEV